MTRNKTPEIDSRCCGVAQRCKKLLGHVIMRVSGTVLYLNYHRNTHDSYIEVYTHVHFKPLQNFTLKKKIYFSIYKLHLIFINSCQIRK